MASSIRTFAAAGSQLITVAVAIAIAPGLEAQAPPPIDTALARQYFAEAADVVRRDGGALWGIPFDGTLIFGDQATRSVVASKGDTGGVLRRAGSVWLGTMPGDQNVANTAAEWGGVRWTTIRWSPPAGDSAESRALRAELFAHELWHGIQVRLGLPMNDAPNAHLDEREGRIWLRLEARALHHAVGASGEERRAALQDALRFRAARHARFDSAADAERKLERHEGMASYTGLRLSGRDSAAMIRRARALLDDVDTGLHLARSFAYGTGPAYGILLDDMMPKWRDRVIAGAAPAELLREALPMDGEAGDVAARATRYGYEPVALAERARERERDARRAKLSAILVDGPVLRLPFEQMQMQLDPQHVEPLGAAGTVYRAIRISDRWGVLEAGEGAVLLASDFSHAAVARPADAVAGATGVVRGDGWTLTLAEGYELRAGKRAGDLSAAR
jgi:hypothetical protein